MALEVFPVVHVREASQAVEQAGMAFEMGADGVYLIDHNNIHTDILEQSFNQVALQYPNSFIGLNYLQHPSAFSTLLFLLERTSRHALVRLPDGLWADDAEVDKERFLDLRTNYPELASIRYLGGVAFKYTSRYTDNPEKAAEEAIRLEPFVDVITTSGAGTGKPPSPEKIAAMRAAIRGKKLAVASGISLENLTYYNGSIDQLLVSTSIEVEPYSGIFDPSKLKELVDLAHAQ